MALTDRRHYFNPAIEEITIMPPPLSIHEAPIHNFHAALALYSESIPCGEELIGLVPACNSRLILPTSSIIPDFQLSLVSYGVSDIFQCVWVGEVGLSCSKKTMVKKLLASAKQPSVQLAFIVTILEDPYSRRSVIQRLHLAVLSHTISFGSP